MKNNFDELVSELDGLNKSLSAEDAGTGADMDDPEDDEKIADAAAEGGEGGAEAEAAGEDDNGDVKDDDDDDDEDEDEELGKSFTVKLANGEQVEAVDGTELVKSLAGRVDGFDATLGKALSTTIASLKGVGGKLADANKSIAEQGALIKSLQDAVARIGGEGRGRKTVLSVHEKPAAASLAKAEESEEGISGKEFLGKAMEAFSAGRITGQDVSMAEACINRNIAPPEALIKRVVGQGAA